MKKMIQTKQGNVHYQISGTGPGVLLLHGGTMDGDMWQYQIEYFSREFQVICPDIPAHGASRPYTDFSLAKAASALRQILLQEGVEKVHLVGQSMGGYISQIFALEYPAMAQSLVAVDSSPCDSSFYSAFDRWMLSITPGIIKMYPYNMLIKTITNGVASSKNGRKYALETLKKYTKDEISNIMLKVSSGLMEYSERDFTFQCPVYIVCGDKDKSGKVISYSKRWSKQKGYPLVFIPDAAHNSNMDNPKAFNSVVMEFLKK